MLFCSQLFLKLKVLNLLTRDNKGQRLVKMQVLLSGMKGHSSSQSLQPGAVSPAQEMNRGKAWGASES